MIDDENAEVGEFILPLVEERITVGKQVVDGKTITVRTRLAEDAQLVAEDLTREAVSVKRVSVDRPVDQPPRIREEGDLIIIPVFEERLIISKQLVVTEEIHLQRTRTTATQQEEVTTRRTEVEISDAPPAR